MATVKDYFYFIKRQIPIITEFSLAIFLIGLFFPELKIFHSIGLFGCFMGGLFSFFSANKNKPNFFWSFACVLMLVAGFWGVQLAPDPVNNWKYFWSYQAIGKGLLCALALSFIYFSPLQIKRLLFLILFMLLAKNIEMGFYAYRHPVFISEEYYGERSQFLLAYRAYADSVLLFFPFVFASALVFSKHKFRFLFVLIGLLDITLLLSTGWRGAWLGFICSCVFLVFIFGGKRVVFIFLLSSVCIILIGLIFSGDNLITRAILRGASDSNRIQFVWTPVLDILAQNQWQGFGFGQVRYLEVLAAYAQNYPEKGILVFGDAHNMILNFAMAAGWLGALAFLVLLGSAILSCLARLRNQALLPEQRIFIAGTAAAWLGVYGVLGLTDQPDYHNLPILLVLTTLALARSRSC